MDFESYLYKKLDNFKVLCKTCSRYCVIPNNDFGFCNTRMNKEGILYSINYGLVTSISIDPIEKKPITHYLKDSSTLSIGGFGCNMSCLNCQNYTISQKTYNQVAMKKILPEDLVEMCIDYDCPSISWTYNEPTLHLEYSVETAKLAKKKNIKTIYVTNAYMSKEALDIILKHVDAFSIDLKSLKNDFYKKICDARVEPIIENIKRIYKSKKHIELDYLIIPGFNDSDDEIKSFVNFVSSELSTDIPVHFLRFRPEYKMMDVDFTPIKTMEKAYEIAYDEGLRRF